MSLVDNVDNVAFASSLEVDKLFPTKYSGSFSVAATTRTSSTITHDYGADIFVVMQFSTDNATWYDSGAAVYNASGGTTFQATSYTTSTSIVVVAENSTGSPLTCYYRLVIISDD